MVGLEDLLNKRCKNQFYNCRIGFYSVYLVSLQGLPFTLLYFTKNNAIYSQPADSTRKKTSYKSKLSEEDKTAL